MKIPFDICPKCKSEEINPDLVLFDDSYDYNSNNQTTKVGYFANPDAWVFKDKIMGDFYACACTDCGYMEFYLKNPGLFKKKQK